MSPTIPGTKTNDLSNGVIYYSVIITVEAMLLGVGSYTFWKRMFLRKHPELSWYFIWSSTFALIVHGMANMHSSAVFHQKTQSSRLLQTHTHNKISIKR